MSGSTGPGGGLLVLGLTESEAAGLVAGAPLLAELGGLGMDLTVAILYGESEVAIAAQLLASGLVSAETVAAVARAKHSGGATSGRVERPQ